MWAYTAAHKTLPLGTYVKVTNLENGKTVVAKITDRGPFVAGRIIDLSAACAQCLGSYGRGLARVRVEAVQGATEQVVNHTTYWKPAPVASFRYGNFAVQIGAFQNQSNAFLLQDKMKGFICRVRTGYVPEKPGLWYRVQVGAYKDIEEAKTQAQKFRAKGFRGAFVIAVDGQ
jgi:rare lipoprotein A